MTEEIRAKIGRPSPRNKGGWLTDYGRWRMPVPRDERIDHPTVDSKGYIARSHYVWNRARPDDPVLRGQVIHHINGDPLDDRVENLQKFPSQSEHAAHHAPATVRRRRRNRLGQFV